MLTINQDGGIERYDDLHIDIIDPLWKPKPAWMNGGLDAFHAAIKLRDTHKLPFTVGLGLSLDTGDDIGQGGSVSTSDLQARLNWTPLLFTSSTLDRNRAKTLTVRFRKAS